MRLTGAVAAVFLASALLARAGPLPRRGGAAREAERDPLEIPAAAHDRPNPVSPSEPALQVGRALWQANCETCHGTYGRGDGPNARLHEMRKNVAPKDLTDPALQQTMSDGDLFYRLSKGVIDGDNIIMPSYEGKIPSEIERWQLVLYVRELGHAARR